MAYYTVAHLLQGGDMYGQDHKIAPEALTPEVRDLNLFVSTVVMMMVGSRGYVPPGPEDCARGAHARGALARSTL